MPSWQPNWSDVRFDHAQAELAIAALDRCASLLDAQTDRRVALAASAQREWRGRAREVFDDELARMLRQASSLVAAMRALGANLERAAEEARVEQRRRVEGRARWWEEKRREDELRAQQGLPPTPGPSRPRPVRVM